jgi:5-methylcytosine-specific restriction endonuclease McrA
MWLPPSKIGKYKTCGGECAKTLEKRDAIGRTRPCETCGNMFTPRQRQLAMGHGKFCSQKCNKTGIAAANAPEARKKSHESFMTALANGTYVPVTGPVNPRWMGGIGATLARAKEAGKLAQNTRNYRKKYPEKVKEFCMRRKSRKYGRLPRGTIKTIGEYQRWKCVVCLVSIKKKYHLDHIVPLAKGGTHTRENVQLLCPSCNVRKSAKDPIEFMQSRGFLL